MKSRQPNLLWIMADQLRQQAVSCYGNGEVETPRLDRLGREGVICDYGVSHYPVCMPFRAGLVTGQYSHVNGVRVHGDLLTPGRQTVAHAFRAAGYRTSYVGKWHLASANSARGCSWGDDYWVHPCLRGGFEDWFGFDLSNHYYNTHYSTGEFVDAIKIEGYQTDGLADLSLKYLSQTAAGLDQPWFHVLSFEAPHPGMPEQDGGFFPVPAEYAERFRAADMTLRDNVPADMAEKVRKDTAGYYAMIANLDYNIGRVLDWLDESGQAENTLVVFFSDHGEMLGSHGRDSKQVAYDESIRIPLIMRLPGGLSGGSRYDGVVSGVDIFPTCAGLCGVPTFANVQGMDQSAALRGQGKCQRNEVLIQWLGQSRYHWGDHPYRAIRTQRYTYCVSAEEVNEAQGGHFRLLFDNEQDPYQMNNLFGRAEAADLQRQLHGRLCEAIRESAEALPSFVQDMCD